MDCNSTIKLIFRNHPQIWKIILLIIFLLFITAFIVYDIIVMTGLFLIISIVFYVILFFLITDALCWQLTGKEIIEIGNNSIIFYKSGRILQKRHIVSFNKDKILSVLYSRAFYYENGKIQIIDDNMAKFQIGASLTQEEAECLISYLKEFYIKTPQEVPELLKKYKKIIFGNKKRD